MIVVVVSCVIEMYDGNFYFDIVVFLIFFLLLGRYIESYSKKRMGDVVELLGRLRFIMVILVSGFGFEKEGDEVVKVDLFDFGDVVRVLYGVFLLSDGVVIGGESSFDELSLMGELRLVKKGVGDWVFLGMVNKGLLILVRIIGVVGKLLLD